MSTFIGIIVAVIGLGFLILAHEFGHFIVAKLAGMRVEEFSIGFGRYLVSRRIGETVYGISALPLGGYVRVTGMHKEEFFEHVAEAREERAKRQAFADDQDDEENDGDDEYSRDEPLISSARKPRDPEDRLAGPRVLSAEEIAATPLKRRYYSHPFWHKLLFIVAGVTMNVFVAFLLLFGVGLVQGEAITSTVIEVVESGSPAAEAGMMAGDQVVSVAGKTVSSWEDVRTEILTHPGVQIAVVVERQNKRIELTATPEKRQDGTGFLGVQPGLTHKDLGAVGAFGYAGETTGSMVALIIKGIGWMFSGKVPVTGSQGLAGPVGIIELSSQAVQGGYYASLLALISINLAIINMVPLLPLDGGHVLFSIIERIRRKSLSLRTFERVSMVGLVLFVILFIVATSNDVGRIFGG
ncbi:MAG: RIP metalloprotease RseP [Actinobacteria bacterium]|nr:RIP metalloprotease RseP [Actinomycetota bacterium]